MINNFMEQKLKIEVVPKETVYKNVKLSTRIFCCGYYLKKKLNKNVEQQSLMVKF